MLTDPKIRDYLEYKVNLKPNRHTVEIAALLNRYQI